VTRNALLKRLDLLEARLAAPPTLVARVLGTATDVQLERLEEEIEQGRTAVWEALLASYRSGGSGS